MKTYWLIFFILISGCAVNISTDSFVYQDDKVEEYLDLKQIQSKMTYDPTQFSLSELSVTTVGGVVLKGVKLSNKEALVNIVLFGGNGMKISRSFRILDRFSTLPANIIWFDYRGTGVSGKSGELNVVDLKADALTVFDFSKENLPNNIPTLIHGISMGSLLASYVAVERNVDGLILDSALGSVTNVVENMTPLWMKLFSTVNISPELSILDNTQIIKNYEDPLLVIVAKDDSITPKEVSEKLYNTSKSPVKTLAVILDSEHGKPMKKVQTIKVYLQFIKTLLAVEHE